MNIKKSMFVTAAFAFIYAFAAPLAFSQSTINACYVNLTGVMRFVTTPTACTALETALTWNVQGVQGNQGAQGATGAQGPQGVPGAQGPSGFQLKTVDSNGHDFGFLFSPAYVVKEINGYWVSILFDSPGGPKQYNGQIFFTTTNCSGTKYLQAAGTTSTSTLVGNVLTYSTSPVLSRTFYSKLSNGNPCALIDPPGETVLAAPGLEFNLSTFTGPYTIEQLQ